MTLPFLIIGAVTVGSAMAAMALRNLVHCALCLVVTFAGLAALYLQLGAEFVGWAQILVYVGAVSILIVFSILLTRGTEPPSPTPITTLAPWAISIAVAVFVLMVGAIQRTTVLPPPAVLVEPGMASPALNENAATKQQDVGVSVRTLGLKLMKEYVVPLEVMGLLLTAAMIGAVIIALPERMTVGVDSSRAPEDRR